MNFCIVQIRSLFYLVLDNPGIPEKYWSYEEDNSPGSTPPPFDDNKGMVLYIATNFYKVTF